MRGSRLVSELSWRVRAVGESGKMCWGFCGGTAEISIVRRLKEELTGAVAGGCFREFAGVKKSAKPKLIVLDNAPIHRSEEFAEELEELAKLGVFVMFLPGYSPELNLIEILWKKIKYEWLPMDIYGSFKMMSEGLFEVLKGIGSKYHITFV